MVYQYAITNYYNLKEGEILMRSFKKFTSVLLVAVMVLGMFAMMPITASAATENTITVSSNVMDDVTYTYNEYTEQVTVNYYLEYDKKILEQQSVLTYDPAVLKLADTNTEDTYMPVMTNGSMVNDATDGKIVMTSTTTKFYNFKTKGVFVTATFDVIGTGDTIVNLDIEILTATTANVLSEYSEETEVPLVYNSEVKNDFTFEADATLVGDIPDDTLSDITIKFAAPASSIRRFDWQTKEVVFYYGNSKTFSENTLVPMTATAEKFYTDEVGSSTVIEGGNGWIIYALNLTVGQVKAAQNASFVGFATSDGLNRTTLVSANNVLKASVDTYGDYSSKASTLEELNGKTFVIRDSLWGEISGESFVGYWVTDYNTIRFAAPASISGYINWNDVDLYYTNGGTFDTSTKLGMVNTLETTKVKEPGLDNLRAGNWYIYAVSVDAGTASAIETATNVGFSKAGATNMTSFAKNVLKAKVNEFDGIYLEMAKTLDEVEDLVFVVQAPAMPTSRITLNGEWQTEEKYTEGNDDTIKISFAAPIGTKTPYDWNTGVDLYYGNTTAYKDTSRITMTRTDRTVPVTIDSEILDTVASGDWVVYEAELTLEQVKAIDNAVSVGFIKSGSWNRTSTNEYYSIVRASKIDGVTKYNGVKESIEAFDDLTFIIGKEANAAYETSTYLGTWIGQ